MKLFEKQKFNALAYRLWFLSLRHSSVSIGFPLFPTVFSTIPLTVPSQNGPHMTCADASCFPTFSPPVSLFLYQKFTSTHTHTHTHTQQIHFTFQCQVVHEANQISPLLGDF